MEFRDVEGWLDGFSTKERLSGVEKAVACLEHLIDRHFDIGSGPARVLEVGPLPWKENYSFVEPAPVKFLRERRERLSVATMGPHRLTEEYRSVVEGVEYVQGFLSIYPEIEAAVAGFVERISQILGGVPNIIYGRHVFENSPAGADEGRIFPFGMPEHIFEKAADILEPGGFIVVDNKPGYLSQVAKNEEFYSAAATHRMMPHSRYPKGKLSGIAADRGIYVYQKQEKQSSANDVASKVRDVLDADRG